MFDYIQDSKKNLPHKSRGPLYGLHHMGGTIMGNDKSNSVVDKNLKVHDIDNLFVIGSSVFPTGGHANPTLTIVQLANRLGNHLITNYK